MEDKREGRGERAKDEEREERSRREEPREQVAKKAEKEKKLGEGKESPAPGLEALRAGGGVRRG